MFGASSPYLLLTETVFKECEKVAKGLVVEKIPFLKNIKQIPIEQPINRKFHNLLDNNWRKKNRLIKQEEKTSFEEEKKKYIKKGDFSLIFCAMNNESLTIVTEETRTDNDNSEFKKIPDICDLQKINCINLPQLLKELKVHLEFEINNEVISQI